MGDATRRRRRIEPTDEWEQLKLLCLWPEQLAYEEICQVLGLTMSQVKTRLHRARRMFKERYEALTEGCDAV